MKRITQKERSNTGPKHRANESTKKSSKTYASTKTCTLTKPVEPIKHRLIFEEDLPINCEVRRFLDEEALDDHKTKMDLRDLLLLEYAQDIARKILHQSSIRQDYLDYLVERLVISAMRECLGNGRKTSDNVVIFLQFAYYRQG